jgi:hypothetical protein
MTAKIKPYQTGQSGIISIENLELIGNAIGFEIPMTSAAIKGVIGIQIAEDGRIWLCINGIAFIRFSPHIDGKMSKEKGGKDGQKQSKGFHTGRVAGGGRNPRRPCSYCHTKSHQLFECR